MCEASSWRLKPQLLSPTLHKHLYLGSDYRTKGAWWLIFHNTNIYQFSKTSTTRFPYLSPSFNYSNVESWHTSVLSNYHIGNCSPVQYTIFKLLMIVWHCLIRQLKSLWDFHDISWVMSGIVYPKLTWFQFIIWFFFFFFYNEYLTEFYPQIILEIL